MSAILVEDIMRYISLKLFRIWTSGSLLSLSTKLLLYGAVYRYIWENLVKRCLNCCRKIRKNLVKLYLLCHFRWIFVANLKEVIMTRVLLARLNLLKPSC